jgi:transposase
MYISSYDYVRPPTYPYSAMHKLSSSQITCVLTLLDAGLSGAQISLQTHLSSATISRIRSTHRSHLPKASGGRPTKLTTANIDYARRIIRMGKVDNATQATKALVDVTNTSISAQTVRRQLKARGMRPVVKRKRPFLKPAHRKARLEFAERHQEWTMEDWKRVIWSDETKINRLGSDGRKYVWKDVGEGLNDRLAEGTVKFGGGNLMMWGCMGWDGVGWATKIEGRMDAELYVAILDDELQQSLEHFNKSADDIIFQQDNDPKHTSKKAQKWFQDNGITVLKWPGQSPDLNPIEHLWGHVKKQLQEYSEPAHSVQQLWERVEREWEKIPKEVCQNLIESMPRRLAAVIRAKGGYTKY